MNINFVENLAHYVPELLVIATMIVLLFIEAFYKNPNRNRTVLYVVSTLGLLSAMAALCQNMGLDAIPIFANAVIIDPFSTLIKMILVGGTLGATYLSYDSRDIYKELKPEFVIMCFGVLVGGMLLASANNFLTVYLGIETLSILSYVLASMISARSLIVLIFVRL